MKPAFSVFILSLMGALIAAPIWAAEQSAEKPAEHSAEELAKAAQNPIAHMISLPFQENVNFNYGPENKAQNVLNIQPVIPVTLSPDWNLITRTIVPVISQPPFAPGQETEFGLGDIQSSAFFSPAKTKGFVWGVGPIAQLPSHTDDRLGSPIWGLGPTVVALRIDGPWVYGALVNNVWSLGGNDTTKYNNFLLQPFVNYNFGNSGTYLLSGPIITANWRTGNWVVPLGGGIGQIFKAFGKQPVNASLQALYNVAHPEGLGPDWSIRFQVQLLFPK
jgi:hypothetical protein